MTGPFISCVVSTPGMHDITLTVSKNGKISNFTQSLIADVMMNTSTGSFIRYELLTMQLEWMFFLNFI
jgi:hypothetical protein